MACLEDVHAIISVEVALALDRNLEFVIDKVHQDVGGLFFWWSDCKVVNLVHKKDAVAVDSAGI